MKQKISGFTFLLAGSPVTWDSRKQRTVALSSTEAEYMSLTEGTKEALYLCKFLDELNFKDFDSITIFSDNMGAIKIAENPVFHNRSKHIDIKHHFVREVLESQVVNLQHISTDFMTDDFLQKVFQGSSTKNVCNLVECVEPSYL